MAASLEAFELKPDKPAITRIDRKWIAVIVILVSFILLIAVMYGFAGQSTYGNAEIQQKHTTKQLRPFALPEEIATLPGSYMEVKHTASEPTPVSIPVSAKQELDKTLFSVPNSSSAIEDKPLLLEKDVKEQEAAMRSAILFRTSSIQSASVQPPVDITAHNGGKEMISQPSSSASLGGSPWLQDQTVAQNLQSSKKAFLETQQGESYMFLKQQVIPPVSPYQVNASTVIPASLVTGINSDLPGDIIAQVREPVYDSVSGNILVIPQGTRLMGHYDSMVSYGQNRVLMVWNSLIFPNGASLPLGQMTGSDLAGYAGLEDKVDYHSLRLASAVLISSVLGVSAHQVSAGSAEDETTVSQSLAESIATGVADVGTQITKKNLNIQPTITVRPGFSFNVIVQKHLNLPPYRS